MDVKCPGERFWNFYRNELNKMNFLVMFWKSWILHWPVILFRDEPIDKNPIYRSDKSLCNVQFDWPISGLAVWFSVGERAIACLSGSRRAIFSKAKICLQNQFKPKRRGASTFQAYSLIEKKSYYLHRQITRISYRAKTVVAAILYASVLETSRYENNSLERSALRSSVAQQKLS